MDILVNLQAFLATADATGFSAAARKLGVSTSVVAKRARSWRRGSARHCFIARPGNCG